MRLYDIQPNCSLSTPCQRVKLTPQASRAGSKDRVLSGIATSAVQPSPSIRERGIPDALPVPVLAILVGVDRLAAHAVRVHVEHVAGARLVVRIERDGKAVLAEGHVALAQDLGDDRLGPRIVEARREIEVVVVEGDVDARALAGHAELVRDHDVQVLDERRLFPGRVIEHAVEHRGHFDAHGTDRLARRLGVLRARQRQAATHRTAVTKERVGSGSPISPARGRSSGRATTSTGRFPASRSA